VHKKGVFGLEEVFGLAAIAFLLILFLVFLGIVNLGNFLTGGSSQEAMLAQELNQEKEYAYAVLGMPVTSPINEENITLEDFIVYSVAKNDYAKLDVALDTVFKETDFYWSLVIADRDHPEKIYHKISRSGWYSNDLKAPLQEVLVPKYGGEGGLSVKIKIAEGVQTVSDASSAVQDEESNVNLSLESDQSLQQPSQEISLIGEVYTLIDGELQSTGQKAEIIYLGDQVKSGVSLGGGNVYAVSDSGEVIDVGNYKESGKISVGEFGVLQTPLDERIVLEDIDNAKYQDVAAGNVGISQQVATEITNQIKKGTYSQDQRFNNQDVIDTIVTTKIYPEGYTGGYIAGTSLDDYYEKRYGRTMYSLTDPQARTNAGKDALQGVNSCGPTALRSAFAKLGYKFDDAEMNAVRSNGGGFWRSIFAVFDSEARQITWSDEMRDIPRYFGLVVEDLYGSSDKMKADAKSIMAKKGNNVAVIARINLDGFFREHWIHYEEGDYESYAWKEAFVIYRQYDI